MPITLRQLENADGISRDATNLKRYYAEDHNDVRKALTTAEDGINTKEIQIGGVDTISASREATLAKCSFDDGGVVKRIIKGIITKDDTTFETILQVPSNAVLFTIYFYVSEAFTGGQIDIGTATTNNRYATLTTDLLTTGWKTISLSNIPDRFTSSESIGGIFSGSSTAGILEVYFEYAIF